MGSVFLTLLTDDQTHRLYCMDLEGCVFVINICLTLYKHVAPSLCQQSSLIMQFLPLVLSIFHLLAVLPSAHSWSGNYNITYVGSYVCGVLATVTTPIATRADVETAVVLDMLVNCGENAKMCLPVDKRNNSQQPKTLSKVNKLNLYNNLAFYHLTVELSSHYAVFSCPLLYLPSPRPLC
ncbi:hypothetical protein L596_010451 [Steinernema carpocapsae]|uniref:Uncharacterized protein n=1 Tax=Steinernema carpocapsae TaxID=34508 RepID=A0A4U5PIY2_STECR|nr:hypothetical protein L596_010451 [Steinernema carpocapsae]